MKYLAGALAIMLAAAVLETSSAAASGTRSYRLHPIRVRGAHLIFSLHGVPARRTIAATFRSASGRRRAISPRAVRAAARRGKLLVHEARRFRTRREARGWLSLRADIAAPSVPGAVTATAHYTSVYLGWRAARDNVRVARYRVYRDGARVGATGGTSFRDAHPPDGRAYSYSVAAVDRVGNVSRPSAPVTVSPAASSAPATAGAQDPAAGPAPASAPPPTAAPESEGRVHFLLVTDDATDTYTGHATPAVQQFFQTHYWRALTYSPYWDTRNTWYPGWAYKDAYAIYPSSADADGRYILRNASGAPLYIDWQCANGTCPQYAADFGDPGWRTRWIAEAKQTMAAGYRGIFIDDVNLDISISNGTSADTPIDPRTGAPMTESDWRRYMAEFMTEVRAALPGVEIVHNTPWSAGSDVGGLSDPYVAEATRSADYVNDELGVVDEGLTGGSGRWSLASVLDWADRVHSLGAGVIYQSRATSAADSEYNLAAYLLTSNGHDGVSDRYMYYPDSWWTPHGFDLGAASGSRTTWNGLHRRDFERGMALVNDPGAASVSVELPRPMLDSGGNLVTSVTLGPATGKVLRLP